MATIFSTNNHYSVKMGKLKDKVFMIANSDPNNPLSPSHLTFIQQQLSIAFPVFHTPTHPTYSAMIQAAIKDLDEQDGSNEELVSKYIKEKYEGLPWAHNMYLSHHLSKLCENGEIVCDSTRKCYSMPAWARTPEGNSRQKGRKRRLVRKRKKGVNEDEEGNSGGEKVVEESGDVIWFQEEDIEEVGRNEDEDDSLSGGKGIEVSGFEEEDVEEFRRSRTKARRRSLFFTEESDEVVTSTVDEGEQIAVVERPNEELAQEDGDGDANDTAKLMRVPAECVEEAPITLLSSSVTNMRGENDPAGIQEGNTRKKEPKQRLGRKRKKPVNVNDDGDLGRENVVEVSQNRIGFQEENVEECGSSTAKPRRRSLVVTEDNDEVGRTAVDGEEHNLVVERRNEVLAQDDTDNLMLVPAECVEESPVTIISPSVTNIRCDNVPELAVKESGLKESELMLVPYEGNTSMCEVSAEIIPISDTKDRMIICGLASSPEQNQPVRKISSKKRLKACPQEKSKVSLESMPSSSDLAVVPHLLELDPKKPALKKSPKKRLNAGQGKKKVSLVTMPSLPAAAVDCNLLEHDHLQELLPQRAIETKVSGMESDTEPVWLEPMLKEQYFIPCSVHAGSQKSKCNRFCLDCMGDAFCFNCLSHHKDHRIVQIWKYSCHYVVRAIAMQRHLEISNIQTYIQHSEKIVFFNCCPQPKPDKIVTRCKFCRRGLFDLFRFCSLRCKMFATWRQSTKFLPIDQSQQACTLSLLGGPSIEQLETQNNFNPSHLSSLEDPMSVEDEEDLPLQKVLEKCGKRKKQVEQKLTANAPLATEASYLSGSKSPVDLPNSECSKHQIEDQEREGQTDVGLDDVEASMSAFVEGDLPTSFQKCEQEPNQSEATMDKMNSQSKKLKNSGRGRQSKNMEGTKDDAEGLNKPAIELHSQKHAKQLNKNCQVKMSNKIEATKEDVPGSSNLSTHQQELHEPATNQHSQIKPENKDTRKRARKHLEAVKNDATISSDLHLEQQAGSSELEIVVQVRKHKKERRGRPRKREEGTKKGLDSEETNKKPKKVGRGRPRKQQDVSKEDLAVLFESAHKLEETEHKVDDCPDKALSEAHETLERGQAMSYSDVDIHQRKTQNFDGGDQLEKQQEELTCHELEVKQGNSEVESEVRRHKEKSGKNNAIQVPLSSKDQLRSRMKHQSEGRT